LAHNNFSMEQRIDADSKSIAIQDIIGRVPSWIIRSGTTLVFLMVVLFLAGSWIFKYNRSISAPIIIVYENLALQKNDHNNEIIGKVNIPSANITAIKPGQKVLIRLEQYPDAEFGMVTGVIQFISSLPENDTYLVLVDLPQGLVTTFGKEINLGAGLKGSAEIITEDSRLIEKIIPI
jgi:hypothetical protein